MTQNSEVEQSLAPNLDDRRNFPNINKQTRSNFESHSLVERSHPTQRDYSKTLHSSRQLPEDTTSECESTCITPAQRVHPSHKPKKRKIDRSRGNQATSQQSQESFFDICDTYGSSQALSQEVGAPTTGGLEKSQETINQRMSHKNRLNYSTENSEILTMKNVQDLFINILPILLKLFSATTLTDKISCFIELGKILQVEQIVQTFLNKHSATSMTSLL